MKANDIRDMSVKNLGGEAAQATFLREIAAQLAEFNEKFAEFVELKRKKYEQTTHNQQSV